MRAGATAVAAGSPSPVAHGRAREGSVAAAGCWAACWTAVACWRVALSLLRAGLLPAVWPTIAAPRTTTSDDDDATRRDDRRTGRGTIMKYGQYYTVLS